MKQRNTIGALFVATVLLIGLSGCSVNQPKQISFREQKVELNIGESRQLPLDVLFSQNISDSELEKQMMFLNVTYTSANPEIVHVNGTGLAQAVGAGSTIITAIVGELYTSVEIEVHNSLAGIAVQDAVTLLPGETVACGLQAVPIGAVLHDVLLEVENDAFATAYYDKNAGTAQITGLSPGATTITVLCGAVEKTIAVTIAPLLEEVGIHEQNLTVPVGAHIPLTAQVKPESAALPEFVWHSSNLNVAIVDASGTVYGVRPGTAEITLRVGELETKTHVVITQPEVMALENATLPSNGVRQTQQ